MVRLLPRLTKNVLSRDYQNTYARKFSKSRSRDLYARLWIKCRYEKVVKSWKVSLFAHSPQGPRVNDRKKNSRDVVASQLFWFRLLDKKKLGFPQTQLSHQGTSSYAYVITRYRKRVHNTLKRNICVKIWPFLKRIYNNTFSKLASKVSPERDYWKFDSILNQPSYLLLKFANKIRNRKRRITKMLIGKHKIGNAFEPLPRLLHRDSLVQH